MNETEGSGGSYGGSDCSSGGDKSCCVPSSCRNGDENSCSPLLSETATAAMAMPTVAEDHRVHRAADGGAAPEEWQVMQTGFVDVLPPSAVGDTSIRCVVQPPPDMLATHVCVEVGLVKSVASLASLPTDADGPAELPTIVVCSVDVEPCRGGPQRSSEVATTDKAAVSGDVVDDDDGDDGDVLDRISQDLDYLLNRKSGDQTDSVAAATTDRIVAKKQDRLDAVLKRTKL